jgi:hypothetical protein
VESIGSAGAGLVPALRKVLKHSDRRVAQALFCAPSELLSGLDPRSAEAIAGQLRDAGLEISVCDSGRAPVAGSACFEIALRVLRLDQIRSVMREISLLLGMDLERVRDLLVRDPCILVGGVSEATVAAFRRRLEPLGAVLDVLEPHAARFDVFIAGSRPAGLAQLRDGLRQAGIGLVAGQNGDKDLQPLLATDLTFEAADAAWRVIERSRVPATILNRDYHRYDLSLVRATDGPALREVLASAVGIPSALMLRVLANLPVVLLSQARWPEAAVLMERLFAVGAQAEAALLFSQRFGLSVERVGDGERTERVLQWFGRVPAGERQRVLEGQNRFLAGPFTHLQARWLCFELEQVGTRAVLNLL